MSFDYITNPTGVFFRAGKLVKKINAYLSYAQTTYPADLNEISTGYDNANMMQQIAGLAGYYTGLQNGITSQRQALARYIDNTFTDRVTVLEQLGVQSPDVRQVLLALWRQMNNDVQSVKKSTVTLGSVTASAGNLGNGTLLPSLILDGYQPPLVGALSNYLYNGLSSQLGANSETMTLTCAADSQTSGTPEGGERFAWNGNIAPSVLDWQDEGSGIGPTVVVSNGQSSVADGDFQNWGGTGNNTPSNWTITAGTAGVNIFRESLAANVYRKTYSLKMLGDGATSPAVTQAIAPTSLKPRQRYCLSVRIKSSAVPASGIIQINFTGTGYNPAGSEQITIPAASFPSGAFTLYNFFINLPFPLPSNWKLQLQVQTLSNGVSVWFSSLALQPVYYHGGIGLVAVAGNNRFAQGDRFTFTVANDNAGVWQAFFRRYYKFQLPTVMAGSETIGDALAT